nr:LLM class flavin-dependent oxidoreductase [Brevibacterium sp. CS2]
MLRDSVEIAVGADEIGVNGACFRVHHFARQSASPMPLLAAIAARTSAIEVGTGVIDMRYQDRHGDWRTLRPDFLFFIDSDEGVQANIVDPHGAWLPDALAKLRGMARFAEVYGDRFHRIESISRIDGMLRILDFTLPEVRAGVLDAIDADNVYRDSSVEY